MRKALRVIVIITVVVTGLFAASQLIRPERTNPPFDARHSIQAQPNASTALVTVLDRACNDCHSNDTVWSRFTQVAPMSWLISYGVSEVRNALNFSEWSAYAPERRRELLAQACQDVTSGKMPGGPYTMLRPEAALSARDIDTICAAAH